MSRSALPLVLIFTFMLAAQNAFPQQCRLASSAGAVRGEKKIIEGHYSWGFERSEFKPCNENRVSWWLKAPKHSQILAREMKELSGGKHQAPSKRLYIKALACVSDTGVFGHMGAYPRMVEVLNLIEYHPEESGDCSRAGSNRSGSPQSKPAGSRMQQEHERF